MITHPPFFHKLLGTRKFSLDDQQVFARFCGDVNPIHLDAITARKTISGDIVVHGLNAVCWALNHYFAAGGVPIRSCRITFKKPIYLDEAVECRFNEHKSLLTIVTASATLVEIRLREGGPVEGDYEVPVITASRVPAQRTAEQMASLPSLEAGFAGDPAIASRLYPALVEAIGTGRTCDLATTSRIVGMEAPGLHSLFLTLDFDMQSIGGSSARKARVERFDPRFAITTITLASEGLGCRLTALLRSAPTCPPSASEIAARVKAGEFENVRALVIGGSRGLGAASVRIIAAGGGEVTLTYLLGSAEAEKLAFDISKTGGDASSRPLNVLDQRQLEELDLHRFNQVYYFATPKIFGKRSTVFDENRLARFRTYYVDAFRSILNRLKSDGHQVSVFYPSTTALEMPLEELAEYTKAKEEGEQLCSSFSDMSHMTIFAPRLPRTVTDQTASVVAAEAHDPLDVMLPLVRQMTLAQVRCSNA